MAEWWKRLVALIIDGIVVGIPTYILQLLVFVPLLGVAPTDRPMTQDEAAGILGAMVGAGLLVMLISLVIPILYYGILNGSQRGQTVGKMVMKIQVRDEVTGGPIGVGKGILRYVVVLLLAIPCGIPALIDGLAPLWDARRQAWHDKPVNSVVVDAV